MSLGPGKYDDGNHSNPSCDASGRRNRDRVGGDRGEGFARPSDGGGSLDAANMLSEIANQIEADTPKMEIHTMTKMQYDTLTQLVVKELFPQLSEPAASALVALIVDFMLSLYAVSAIE